MVLNLYDRRSEVIAAIKDVFAGETVKFSFELTQSISCEVASPYKNVNLRSWYCPAEGLPRRPGWGIVLSLSEFEALWAWAPVWSQFLCN
jgi:hypothetical protein